MLNTDVLSNPLNWLIVLLMLTIGGIGIELASKIVQANFKGE